MNLSLDRVISVIYTITSSRRHTTEKDLIVRSLAKSTETEVEVTCVRWPLGNYVYHYISTCEVLILAHQSLFKPPPDEMIVF